MAVTFLNKFHDFIVVALTLIVFTSTTSAESFEKGNGIEKRSELVCNLTFEATSDKTREGFEKTCDLKKFNQEISYIVANDLTSSDVKVTIVKGGLKKKNVTLKFKSKIGTPAKYEINVYTVTVK